MPNKNIVAGRATISTAAMGVLRSKQGSTLDIGGVKREAVEDDQGVAGYSEKSSAPSIDATFIKKAGISLKQIGAIVDEDINFEADDGSHHVLQHAWCSEPPTLSGGDIKAKFIGIRCDEISA